MFLVSPDCSGNPFYFFFKNKKIATESGRDFERKTNVLLQKRKKSACKII